LLPEEVSRLILSGHSERVRRVIPITGFVLELQLDYSGLMAKGAYKGWKRDKHESRRKVGCFDFKIFRTDGPVEKPMAHPSVISDAAGNLDREVLEKVFEGRDPYGLGLSDAGAILACEIQFAMLEQEINWGDEGFQSWTLFQPSKGKRPRDYIMAYLRRLCDEPGYLESVEKIRAASGTRGVLPPPRSKEWRVYLEHTDSRPLPWLEGDLLDSFRHVADKMPDNPYYASAYAGPGG
jgi:hypothetical protein